MAGMILPTRYTDEELNEIAVRLTSEFVAKRSGDENDLADFYHKRFDQAKMETELILDRTEDLTQLAEKGRPLLLEGLLPTLRSMTRPTVSDDDFKNLAATGTSAPSRFADESLASFALEYLSRNLNLDLFPWLGTGLEPTPGQRQAACVAVAALIADQKTKTSMRGKASKTQEGEIRAMLQERCGMEAVTGADFSIIQKGPAPGEIFTRETKVAGTKADVVLGLFDGRIMCLECKSTNSAVNSFKRLNHEVLDKVAKWDEAFGRQCVSGGVLEGCFNAQNLIDAQEEGAYLFWSSDPQPLIDFINATKR